MFACDFTGTVCPVCGSNDSKALSFHGVSSLEIDLTVSVCGECHFSYVINQIGDDLLERFYSDLYFSARTDDYETPARYFASDKNMFKSWRPAEQLRTLRHVIVKEKGAFSPNSVLDFGCGHGTMLYYAKQAFSQATLYGVELDVRMHPYLEYLGVLILGNINEVETGSMDCITTSHSLEHIQASSLCDILTEFHRALSDGGALFIEVPNENRVLYSKFYNDDLFPHLTCFSPKSLRFFLEKSGFKVLFIGEAGAILNDTIPNRLERWVKKRLYKCNLIPFKEYGMDRANIRCVAIKQP